MDSFRLSFWFPFLILLAFPRVQNFPSSIFSLVFFANFFNDQTCLLFYCSEHLLSYPFSCTDSPSKQHFLLPTDHLAQPGVYGSGTISLAYHPQRANPAEAEGNEQGKCYNNRAQFWSSSQRQVGKRRGENCAPYI